MSVWSAIDLPDRNAVESLIQQIEALQNENRALHAENKRLLSNQLSEGFSVQHTAYNQVAQTIVGRLQEMHRDLSSRMDGMAQMLYGCIQSENATTRDELLMADKKIHGGIGALSSDLRVTAESLERSVSAATGSIQQKISAERDLLASALEDARVSSSEHHQEMKELLIRYFEQTMAQQKQLSDETAASVQESNRTFLTRFEQYCNSALKSISEAGDAYLQMKTDERESLDKIRSLSRDMLELGEHQKNIMGKLSQLCEDSDQFFEIQKSINDIWEIMKVVWVDSLLTDFEKTLA